MVELECRDTGTCRGLAVADWEAPATEAELELLESVRPAVLDVGCGPGRIAHALGARGVPALGIDVAPAALRSALAVGAAVLERSVFDPLPGEGRWGTALLFDGNVGIGGDPVALLARISELLVADGDVLVELGAPGTPTRAEQVRLVAPGMNPGPWFGWATVSVDGVEQLAGEAGLCVRRVESVAGRHFGWLRARAPVVLPLPRSPDTRGVAVAVIAKQPVAGRVKTRLSPPCSPDEAARVASAALSDTFSAVAACDAKERIAFFDGDPAAVVPDGFSVRRQPDGSLGERLDALFAGIDSPAIVVGMDTPQLGTESIERVSRALCREGVDAVLGMAPDGGYWTIGFRRWVPGAFAGVEMSTAHTASSQLARLTELGLEVALVHELRDIDHWEDALAVAELFPWLDTASAVRGINERIAAGRQPAVRG